MSYYLLNSYCTPNPYTVVDPLKPVEAGITLNYHTSSDLPVGTQKPEIFGPSFWFILHSGSVHLPENLSPISANRLKAFVNGIPEMLPCVQCSEHARSYIEANRQTIENFKRGDDVFKFYVDFHNFVNIRLGKPLVSYDQAYRMYKGGANVNYVKY